MITQVVDSTEKSTTTSKTISTMHTVTMTPYLNCPTKLNGDKYYDVVCTWKYDAKYSTKAPPQVLHAERRNYHALSVVVNLNITN